MDMPVTVPCGRCIGCRLAKSRQWAVRCVHEASLYNNNCFITLTYSEKYLPKDGSLDKRAFVLFMKRLRKKFGSKIRFFMCGEYGEQLQRPHYHACLFNFDFEDKYHYKTTGTTKLYRSLSLEKIWKFGYSTIGEVTFESAAYVARYVMKKITGQKALLHYNQVDKETGEVMQEKTPEYNGMSRMPGIGKGWFDKFQTDVYPDDKVIIRHGFICQPPRYYDNLYDIKNHDQLNVIKRRRTNPKNKNKEDNTLARLQVREKVQQLKAKKLIRSYEKEQE